MVAFDENVGYKVTRVGGLKSTLFSGEGLVCELTGPGKIFLQSRSDERLSHLASPPHPEAQLAEAPEQQAQAADVNHRRTEPAQEIA